MTQLSQPRRTRILSQTMRRAEELHHHQTQRRELGMQCRAIFERIRPQLIETHYNWFIAIDADSENYLLDLKLEGLLQQVRDRYTNKALS
ncbi:hypothetical protein [Scytonema sp. NUACC26]|uniref:hypothetical protein n=1 Tax=Scytonema sp. NUACC26 TaxID=3140176 RepID=UPI0034DBB10E